MKRKLTSIILSVAIVLSMMPVSGYAAIIGSNTVVKGRTNISAVDCYDFSFDFRDLTVGSNTVYSDELSILSILLSADMGDPGYIKIVNGDRYVLEQLGFEDVRKIDLKTKYQNYVDSDDYVVFLMGRKTITIGFTDYVIYAVAVRGTVDAEEWMSNFDFGADTDEYAKMCGDVHPDWKEHVMHKGFNVTANRVYKELEEYIKSYEFQDEGMKKSILVTGHSRGAAVANILGKKFEDQYRENGMIKPYTYTFGTPNVTTEPKSIRSQYKTIFNVINDDDLVPFVPLNSWGFYRYGRDIHSSVEKKYKKEWKADNMGILSNSTLSGLLESSSDGDLDSMSLISLLSELVDGNTYDFQDYKSASGSKVDQYATGLLSAYPVTREGEYECRDIVWIPQDISDSYSKYYTDLPYGELAGEDVNNETQKSKFEAFERSTKCKRVKISTMFFFCSLTGIMKSLMDGMDEITVGRVKELIKYIVENADNIEYDPNYIQSLLDKSQLDNDVLNLLCMYLVTYDRDIESGPIFTKALKKFNDRGVLEGFISSHMPSTYYFLVNQALENKDSVPAIFKVYKGKKYEISSNVYEVTSVLKRTVSLVEAGNAPIIFIPDVVNIEGESYKVTGLGEESFKNSEAKVVVVGTKWLTKEGVESAFKDSDVNKAIIMIGDAIYNLKILKKYADIFEQSIVGRTIKLITN